MCQGLDSWFPTGLWSNVVVSRLCQFLTRCTRIIGSRKSDASASKHLIVLNDENVSIESVRVTTPVIHNYGEDGGVLPSSPPRRFPKFKNPLTPNTTDMPHQTSTTSVAIINTETSGTARNRRNSGQFVGMSSQQDQQQNEESSSSATAANVLPKISITAPPLAGLSVLFSGRKKDNSERIPRSVSYPNEGADNGDTNLSSSSSSCPTTKRRKSWYNHLSSHTSSLWSLAGRRGKIN